MNFIWILLVSLTTIPFKGLADEGSLDEKKVENVTSSAQDVTSTSAPKNISKTNDEDKTSDRWIVKLRGLPWTVTVDDIVTFFGDCDVKNGKEGIHLIMTTYGRLSGEAYVELATPKDVDKMLQKNHVYMGQRYIEVVRSTPYEMEWMVSRFGTGQEYVRIRGFARGTSEEEIRSFFSGLKIAPNGIIFLTDEYGTKINEAFVRFVDSENADKAMNKNMEKIGRRFVEVYRSNFAEVYSLTGEGTNLLFRSRSPGSNQANGSVDINAPSGSYGAQKSNMDSGANQFGDKLEEENECVVKLRGLPWSVTVEDILSFLGDCKVRGGTEGIHLTMSPAGRPSGVAFVDLMTPEDATKVLEKHHQYMGQRYIDVSACTRAEMNRALFRYGVNLKDVIDEGCVLIRGIPHGCTKGEIIDFFSELEIKPNGINFVKNYAGRATGEVYIQFVDKENVDQALKKHMEKIGHRYIEVFRTTLPDGRSQTRQRERPAHYDRYDQNNRFDSPRFSGFRRNNNWNNYDGRARWNNAGPDSGGYDDNYENKPRHTVYMRGVPFKAGKDDISWFFSPLKPINIEIILDGTDRPTGRAIVEFASHKEAVEAMRKDKEYINSRFIELRLESFPEYESNYVGQDRGAGMRPDMVHSQGSGSGSWRDNGPRGGYEASRGHDTRSYASSSGGGGGFRSNW